MSAENIYSLTIVLPKPDHSALFACADICGSLNAVDIQEIKILSESKVIDLSLTLNSANMVKPRFKAALAKAGIYGDFCLQKNANRKKKLLICDMDSTLIGQECIDELADFAGVKEKVSEITERAMRGELDFEAALKERVGLLKGLPLQNLQTCFEERISLNAGAKTLAATMSKHGAKTVIVSGGFTFFTNHIAAATGFEIHQANTLLDDGSALTGTVGMPILGREAKRLALLTHSKDFGGPSTAIAIGDGANDLAMIQSAGLGIAYRAKPIVADAAHCAIDYSDLTTALYFQGFTDSEFAN